LTFFSAAAKCFACDTEPLFAPPPLLLRMCEAGLLGRKVGQGFFGYP
jgi:3-hydroxybutyryl-CoA dehydrogenase